MKHRSSQILFAHWNEKRANRTLPERSEIDPAGIRSGLGDTFILAFNPLTEHPFRLAGTRVCALFGRELKGASFAALWKNKAAPPITRLVATAVDDSAGVVAGVQGNTADGQSVDLELLLLPLRHCGQTHLRLIGSLAPIQTPYWLGSSHLVSLSLGEHRFLTHTTERRATVVTLPPPIAVASPSIAPRIRHGLMVYDGGQT
jgi:hypothetical protein